MTFLRGNDDLWRPVWFPSFPHGRESTQYDESRQVPWKREMLLGRMPPRELRESKTRRNRSGMVPAR